jgi:ferritin-like protein
VSNYHESLDRLTPETQDLSRAIHSLMEELEAVDWYQQRIDAASDPELRAILAHNRDEEKEHAAMVLEWIRRRDPVMDAKLREILFKSGPIAGDHGTAEPQAATEAPAVAPRPAAPALTVGRLGPSDTK